MRSHLLRHNSRWTWIATAALAVTVSACGETKSPLAPSNAPVISKPASATVGATASVTPIYIEGASNWTCQQLADAYAPGATWIQLKIDPNPIGAGPFTYSDGVLTVNITNASESTFDWTSNMGVDAVFVKSGASGHNLYLYNPESKGDTNLIPPGQNAISHIAFCYDIELQVSKTATTAFSRDYDWTIAKSSAQAEVTLSAGQQFSMGYSVTVTKDAGTDSDWAVSGSITVMNPHPTLAANGVVVTDSISGVGSATVSCPSTTIAAGATMTCTYGPMSLPDGTNRTNTASASTTTVGIGSGSGSADVTFGAPTIVADDCVDVSDTYAGTLGNTCATHTYTYSRMIVANTLQCGSNTITNTASLKTDDEATETSSASVNAIRDCPSTGSCVLSAGYWKTHSTYGPAPYNETWSQLGEDTTFYLSGHSYYDQMGVPAQGNAYNILAFQYIAAKLNMLTGATAPAGVDLTAINTFFTTYTPAQVALLKGNNAVRQQAIGWATALEAYNTGLSNVNHCSF